MLIRGRGTSTFNFYDPSCDFPVNEYLWLNDIHPTYPMHNFLAAKIIQLIGSWYGYGGIGQTHSLNLPIIYVWALMLWKLAPSLLLNLAIYHWRVLAGHTIVGLGSPYILLFEVFASYKTKSTKIKMNRQYLSGCLLRDASYQAKKKWWHDDDTLWDVKHMWGLTSFSWWPIPNSEYPPDSKSLLLLLVTWKT